MKIGTKSVLFGVHCFLIHPVFVALGWFKLYGFRRVYIGQRVGYPQSFAWRSGWDRGGNVFASLWRPALWVAFVVHDVGYWGKPNMDGPEGESHPRVGAAIMRRLFGEPWGRFTLYHSRYVAKADGAKASPLCMADKLAFPLTPRWLYLPMARATGELAEYMAKAEGMNAVGMRYDHLPHDGTEKQWHDDVARYVTRWVDEHRDGRDDTWTDPARKAASPSGVFK